MQASVRIFGRRCKFGETVLHSAEDFVKLVQLIQAVDLCGGIGSEMYAAFPEFNYLTCLQPSREDPGSGFVLHGLLGLQFCE